MKVKVSVDTVELTSKAIAKWEKPPFQRELRVNAKVRALAERLKNDGGVVSGVITLGKIKDKVFLVDGQHRIEAFRLSEIPLGYADVRLVEFETMAEMSAEFEEINGHIAALRPDDILRASEFSNAALRAVRKLCPFVGYNQVRRNATSSLLSMAATLRVWAGATSEIPGAGAKSAKEAANALSVDEAKRLAEFLNTCRGAWGEDREYVRLWSSLNLTVVAWLWRRIVLTRFSTRTTQITAEEFGKLAASLSASTKYVDWLQGRNLSERDRGPCYRRVALLFARRYEENHGRKLLMPSPAWVSSGGSIAKNKEIV